MAMINLRSALLTSSLHRINIAQFANAYYNEGVMIENLFIGPAGWSYPDWDGIVYPSQKSKSFDPLAFIASYFNLIEINSTFYRIPDPTVTRRWTKRIEHNSDFVFTAKLHRNFTHGKGPFSQRDMSAFVRAVTPIHLEDRLGFILAQFPWSFRYTADARKLITRLTSALAPLPVAVEVRHGSWENKDVVPFIEENHATLCCIDQPLIGQSLTPAIHHAGPAGAYFRLHGRNAAKWFGKDTSRNERYDYMYSLEELSKWASKIAAVGTRDKKKFVVTNNHFQGQAVANAFELEFLITKKKVPLPSTMIDTYPALKKIGKQNVDRTKRIKKRDVQRDLFDTDSAPEE
jgi:uncharacterized protein YecE (DUF72 family)